MSTSTRRKPKIRFAKESDVFDAVYRAVRAALATPGSGECRFEMGHTAPEEKPGQTVLQPAAPAPAARSAAAQPKRGGFTTLSAAEYRALNGLTAPRACAPAADGAGRSECTGHTACPGRAGGTVPEARLHGEARTETADPGHAGDGGRNARDGAVTIPTPQPMPHAVSDDTVLDILPELPDEAPATDPETDYVRNDPHALSALPTWSAHVPSRRR